MANSKKPTGRKPATKFAHLRKKMDKANFARRRRQARAKERQPLACRQGL